MKYLAKIFAVLLVVFYGSCAFAQFLSGIQGTVQDQSGAAVAGAKVTITDTRLGVTKTTTTSDSGFFRFDSIGASNYTIHVEQSGFTSWDQKDLILQPGEIRTVTPTLSVGSATTSVTVQASAVQLDLVTPTTSSVVGSTTVQNTPLPGQNVYGLTTLTPGMTGSAVTSGDNYTNEYAVNINAAGLRQEQNGYQIDGAYTNTPSRGGGSSISPNPSIVDSMDIRTNDFDAAKGRNGGATVDIFTKSGSNDFHGSIDYYFLNNNLSARTEFETTVPAFTRNEIGATFGGPIIRNKFFIFGAIDVLRSSTTSAGQYTVETQAFDTWAESNLPNNIATGILQTAPPLTFPTSNILTVAQIESSSYFPAPANIPGTLAAVGTADISYSVPKDGYQWSVRGDYYPRQNDRVYVTAIRTYDTTEGASARPNLNDDEANSSDFMNVDWTHTFSPRLLNEAGANIIRPYGSDLAVPTMNIPYVNVTGLTGFSNWGPGNFTQQTLGWRDMMTATFKNHSLKFGFEQFNIRENDAQSGAFSRPTYNFNSLLDFVQDEALTESATPVSLETRQQAPYERRYRGLYTGIYVQDSWKVAPTLTFNAGVRYDMMSNFFSILSPQLTNFTLGSGATYNDQIANGVTGLTPNNHVLDHDVWGLGPRIGFSWDVFGTGKTALRGGVGMFSDQPPYIHITDITAGNLPNYYTPSLDVRQGTAPVFQLCSAPSGFTEACPIVDTSNISLNSAGGVVVTDPNTGVQTIQRASLGGYSPDYKLTRVEAYTLSLQQELPYNMIFEVNYSGTSARHLPIFNQDLNRFAGDLVVNKGTLERLNPNFNAIAYATSNGNSNGNYLSAMLARRFTHGLAFRGIYTWGKALDFLSNAGSLDSGAVTTYSNGSQGSGPIFTNNDLKAQYGRADFDIRQQFSADATWTVPNDYNALWKRSLFGGWQFGGVWLIQSGLPFTVYTTAAFAPVYDTSGNVVGNTGGDYNADGSDLDIPNTPSFGNHLPGQSRKAFLNGLFSASDFPTPAVGTEGNLGRNTYDGPGYNNVDFTFERLFHAPWFFKEKMQIEAKGEVTNLFNRANLLGMNSDLSNPTLFGHSTSQFPARYLQMHIRASF